MSDPHDKIYQSLWRYGQYYALRYPSSTGKIIAKLKDYSQKHEFDTLCPSDILHEFYDQIIVKLRALNACDDMMLARLIIESYVRKGASTINIKQQLKKRLLPADIINQSWQEYLQSYEDDDGYSLSQRSLLTLARKKKRAIFRDADMIEEMRHKDTSYFARNGHSYDDIMWLYHMISFIL